MSPPPASWQVEHRWPVPVRREVAAAIEGLGGAVVFNAPLAAMTSLRIGGPADVLVTPGDVHDVCRVVRQASAARVPLMVFGGTNLLVRDGGVRGLVVSLSGMTSIEREDDGMVFAEAGARMPVLLGFAASHALSGLEWAAGIPGTVGGAVAMNAGTQLGEMKDCLEAVQLATPEGRLRTCAAADLGFAYRRAGLPAGVVVGAWLRLTPAPRAAVAARTASYLRYRKQSQPLSLPNAGSVFKNPSPDMPAGRVIEEAGCKGRRVGDAQVSDKHANFIVNLGQARAADALRLVACVRREVVQHTGVRLELEWSVAGEDAPSPA